MSVEIMSRVWKMEEFDSPTEKLILLCFADFANDEGECWPKIATVAFKSCCTIDHVSHVIKKFEERGYLRVERARGRGRSSKYFLFPKQPDSDHEEEVEKAGSKRGFKKNLLSKTPFMDGENPVQKTPFSYRGHIEPKLDNHQEPPKERDAGEVEQLVEPIESPPENDFRPFESDKDSRFKTPHFFAVCTACDIDLDLVSYKTKCQAAVAAVNFKSKGFTVEEIALVRSRWPFETAPIPSQFQDRFVALLNQKNKGIEDKNGTTQQRVIETPFQRSFRSRRESMEQRGLIPKRDGGTANTDSGGRIVEAGAGPHRPG